MHKQVILALILSLILLTSCSFFGQSGTDSHQRNDAGPLAGGPNDADSSSSSGTVVIVTDTEPDRLSPLYTESASAYELIHAIFSGLNRINDKLEFEPDLATNTPTIENGGVTIDGSKMTVKYTLRQDVVWHDGEPFKPEDVVFTWRALTHPDNPTIGMESYRQIEDIEIVAPDTILIHLKSFMPAYQELFDFVLPSHLFPEDGVISTSDPFNKMPIGTGPFRVADWVPGQQIILEANENYYGDGPYLDRIIYRIVPDPSIRVTQLKTGEADIAFRISPGDVASLERMEQFTVYNIPILAWEHLDFNLEKPLFQDRAVRQALKWAIDREQIVDVVFQGTRQAAASYQVPMSWAYNPNITVNPRDVNKAKQLLEEAGWVMGPDGIYEKNGQRLSFAISTTAGHPQREQIEQIIQQQAREAGFEIMIKNYDANTLFGDVMPNRRFDTILFFWHSSPDPDVHTLFHSSQIPSGQGGGQNYIGYRNEEMDELLDKARATLDREVRREAYWRVQEILDEDVPTIAITYEVDLSAARADLENYKPNPSVVGNLWNAGSWRLRSSR